MQNKTRQGTIAIIEGALMVAFAIVLDHIIPMPSWPQGGSISVAAVPIIFYAYRRGLFMGGMAALVWSITQLLIGPFYVPPANTMMAIVLCVLLDYILGFTVIGTAPFFAGIFKKRRLFGYGAGAAIVCFIRFLFSYLSGATLFGSYADEGVSPWLYSFLYNGGYMLPNMVLTALLIVGLCAVVDPLTLRPMKKNTGRTTD